MARFKYTNKSQGMFLSINLKEQLVEGTLEWAIDYLINKTDISIFEKNYNNDEKGAAAYSPKILLKIVLFCYSRGILTSRKMEMACKENIITKALAEDSEPDHATIAAFISNNYEAVIDLFVQVILQCAELGLITGEMFAGDGCKLPSNASKEWSGKIKDFKKKRDKLEKYIASLLQKHSQLDKDEEAKKKLDQFRETMGDDKKRRSMAIERLEKKLKKINTFIKDAKPRMGLSTEEIKSNITDNESAFIKSPHGYIQGYNGVTITDSAYQIIIAAETSDF
jgi:transposase